MSDTQYAKRISVEQVEEGRELAPKFDENGLVAAVTTDAKSGDVLNFNKIRHGSRVEYVNELRSDG